MRMTCRERETSKKWTMILHCGAWGARCACPCFYLFLLKIRTYSLMRLGPAEASWPSTSHRFTYTPDYRMHERGMPLLHRHIALDPFLSVAIIACIFSPISPPGIYGADHLRCIVAETDHPGAE